MQQQQTTNFAHGRLDKSELRVPSLLTEDEKRQRQCIHCHQYYHGFQNKGAWRCRTHCAPWDADRHQWTCCGTNNPGCIGADHYDDEKCPYPSSGLPESESGQVFRGVPTYRLLYGNLQELQDVAPEAIQYPADFAEQFRTLGPATPIDIYRRCLFGIREA